MVVSIFEASDSPLFLYTFPCLLVYILGQTTLSIPRTNTPTHVLPPFRQSRSKTAAKDAESAISQPQAQISNKATTESTSYILHHASRGHGRKLKRCRPGHPFHISAVSHRSYTFPYPTPTVPAAPPPPPSATPAHPA